MAHILSAVSGKLATYPPPTSTIRDYWLLSIPPSAENLADAEFAAALLISGHATPSLLIQRTRYAMTPYRPTN